MARRQVARQHDFSFGELSPEHAASGDRAAVAASLKKARNVRLLNSYAISQRPGSRQIVQVAGNGKLGVLVTVDGTSYNAVIRAAAIDIYTLTGVLIQSVTGAPWSEAQALAIVFHVDEDMLYLAHNDFWTRVLTRDALGVWALSLYAFGSGAGNSSAQLYYRFAAKNISVTLGARTGTTTVAFSAAVLAAGHVGIRFRYGASADSLKEFQIATVVDAQNGTATIIDTLPPTYDVTVGSASGFRVGEDVEGQTTLARGVVIAISTNVVRVLMSSGFEGFSVASGLEEYLVGTNTRSKIVTSGQTLVSPAASTVWDEAVFSPVRGYPGAVFEHRDRLGFTDFPQIPDGIAMSAPGAPEDFDLTGADANAAIFEKIGGGLGQRILFAVSSANLIVLTNQRVYYVPESADSPLAADTISFVEIGPTGSSNAVPVTVEDGIIYVESGGNRIVGLLATGDITSPWRIIDLSRRSSHLINNPVSLAMTNGNAQAPERYVFVLNEDGTVACLFTDQGPPARLGWALWSGAGFYRSMASIQGVVYALCERQIAGETRFLLERFDENAQLDASSSFADNQAFDVIGTYSGDVLAGYDGPIRTYVPALAHLAGATVHVVRGTAYLGQHTVNPDGTISDIDAADGDFEAGLHFDLQAVQWPVEVENDDSPGFKRRRIPRVAVRTQNTGVFAIGLDSRTWTYLRPAYDQSDNIEIDPPLRSEVKRVVLPGWEYEPCVSITRPIPHPVTILSIAAEASF